LKCGDGTCIDPETNTCGVAICPKETPIKCSNGLCSETNAGCSASTDQSLHCINNIAEGNIVPCADGRCVTSAV